MKDKKQFNERQEKKKIIIFGSWNHPVFVSGVFPSVSFVAS